MKITKAQLKQIIKEELAKEVFGRKDPGDEFGAAVKNLITMARNLNHTTKDKAIREMTKDVYQALTSIPGFK